MAQYKSAALHRTYRRRLRPVHHDALGWLPRWAGMVTRVPAVARLVNAVLGRRPVAKLVMRLGGMDPRREMVSFTPERFSAWARGGDVTVTAAPRQETRQVLLWADSFSEQLVGARDRELVRLLLVLADPILVSVQPACLGIPW